MRGHGGRRVAGDGKRLGAPTAAERLSKATSTGTPSVASYFGGKPAARSEEVGSPREREPGGTPTKQQVTRAKREAPTQPGAESLEQATAIGAGPPASSADDHDYSGSEVVYSHTVTKAQRDAELRAAAVKVEDDDDGAGGSASSDSHPNRPPPSPPLSPKKEPSDSARQAARPPASRTEAAAEMPSLLGAFLEGVDGALRSAVTRLKTEALRVRFFVREHKGEWMVERPVYGEDGKKITTEKRLAIVGEQSIAHTLFTEPDRVQGATLASPTRRV